MATLTATIPQIRRPRQAPVAGRSALPEVIYVKRIDNSRLRREVDGANRRRCYRLLPAGVVLFLLGMVYALQHFQCVNYGYENERLKQEKAQLQESNRRLRLEQAALTDPERINDLAREKLGLAPTSPSQRIRAEALGVAQASVTESEYARNLPALNSMTSGLSTEGLAREP